MAGKSNLKFTHQPIKWVKGNAVGSGSFGVVNMAMNKANGRLFVVKSAPTGPGFRPLKNEAEILQSLNSPHIVQYLGHDVSNESNGEQRFNLFMEFMAGGSLSDILKKFGGGALDESVIRSYTREILRGLCYLHRNGIVHCDLKCKNVLLGSSGNVKLADFGAAQKLNSPKTDTNLKNFWQFMCGTPLWMAPEVLRNEELDYSSDIWSLGCTVIEMATGRLPWGDEISISSNPMAAIYKIACGDKTPQFPSDFSKQGIDFLRKCLERDPNMRWSSEELLRHPYVSVISEESCSDNEDSWSPTSVLDDRDWNSDGSESPNREDLMFRLPFSKRCSDGDRMQKDESFFAASGNWFVVRSS